jgi:hypothetical protein
MYNRPAVVPVIACVSLGARVEDLGDFVGIHALPGAEPRRVPYTSMRDILAHQRTKT